MKIYQFVAIASLCWFLTGVANAATGIPPGPTVTPEWLEAHRNQVTILDVRDNAADFSNEPKFDTDAKSGKRSLTTVAGHIPGALLLEFSKVRGEKMVDGKKVSAGLPDAEHFQQTMQAAGVSADRPIVIVTQAVVPEDLDTAARLYWSLKYYGGTDLAILDGGMARWLEEGRSFETAVAANAAVTKGDWKARAPRAALLADADTVAKAKTAGVQVVDARPLAFFYGLQKRPVVASAGHIAGAVALPTELRSRPVGKSQRYLSASEYRSILTAIGLKPQAPTIAYCNTAHMASGAWFIFSEILGNSRVAVYDGSMLEWAAQKRPVVALQ
jgi:thiosulfate/3-mercaptopyruvate sulfurtransferase